MSMIAIDLIKSLEARAAQAEIEALARKWENDRLLREIKALQAQIELAKALRSALDATQQQREEALEQ